jgi:hypothetical protein
MIAHELELHPRLAGLLNACQKACVSECCGIEAYDFSLVHVASYLSAFSGVISDDDIRSIEDQLDAFAIEVQRLVPDEHGYICSIGGTNQYFTEQLLSELILRMRHAVRLAPRVIDAVRQIEEASGHSRFVRE